MIVTCAGLAASALVGACAGRPQGAIAPATKPAPTLPEASVKPALDPQRPITTIALGSCLKEDQPTPALSAAARIQPDLFVFLGDNMYGDSTDMNVFREKYAKLAAQPGLVALRAGATRILATWDDHDYGDNDLGREYTMRRESQALFCDFWGEAESSPRRTRDGIYDALTFGPQGQRVQVILLDTRFNRSELRRRPPETMPTVRGERGAWWSAGYAGDYLFDNSQDATILGEAQWAWLEEQLRQPAEVRVIASSIQFVSEEHRFENWANFPRERVRMVELINRTGASGVVFVSGDRHWAEISSLMPGALTSTPPTFEDPSVRPAPASSQPRYPLFDLTASAINRPAGDRTERNRHRLGDDGRGTANALGGPYPLHNFGLITINWDLTSERRMRQGEVHVPTPTVTLEVRDGRGAGVLRRQVRLSELR